MDKKIKKGMYGYRDAHKKRQILLVSLFLLVTPRRRKSF